MRTLATLLVVLGLCVFTIGCGDASTPPPEGDESDVVVEEPADMSDDTGEAPTDDTGEAPADDTGEEPAEDGGEE